MPPGGATSVEKDEPSDQPATAPRASSAPAPAPRARAWQRRRAPPSPTPGPALEGRPTASPPRALRWQACPAHAAPPLSPSARVKAPRPGHSNLNFASPTAATQQPYVSMLLVVSMIYMAVSMTDDFCTGATYQFDSNSR